MILREKTLNVMGVVVILLIIALYAFTRYVLLSSFGKLEREYALSSIRQVKGFVLQETEQFARENAERACSDELVRLARSPSEAGLGQLFPAPILRESKLDLVIVVSPPGEVLFGTYTAEDAREGSVVPIDLRRQVLGLVGQARKVGAAMRPGFLAQSDGPLLVAANAIPRSDGDTQTAPWLIVGQRWVKARFAGMAAARSFVDAAVYDANAPHLSGSPDAIWPAPPTGPEVAHRLMANLNSAYATLEDPAGRPVLALKADMASNIRTEIQNKLTYFALAILAVGLLLVTTLVVVLDKFVLARMNRLITSVATISASGDFSSRVSVKGHDELSHLAHELNALLDTLEQSSAALRENEEKYRNLIERANDGVVITQDGMIRYVNPRFADRLGYNADEMFDTPFSDYLAGDNREFLVNLYRGHMTGRQAASIYEAPFRTGTGGELSVEVNAGLITYNDRPAVLSFIRDITERKKAEAELFHEKEQLSVTVASLSEGVVSTDKSGRVILMNRAAEEVSGREASWAVGKALPEVLTVSQPNGSQPLLDGLPRLLQDGERIDIDDGALTMSSGHDRLIAGNAMPLRSADGSIIGSVIVFRDVTAEAQMRQEMQKIERIESIALLAGGIAHDFNNIVTGILGNISLARVKLGSRHWLNDLLEKSEKACCRIKGLTQQLLTFAKGAPPIKKVCSVSDILTDATTFTFQGSKVLCTLELPDDLWAVNADEGQISQVVSNLAINALQAMPQGGKVWVRAENCVLSGASGIPLPAGNYVKMTVKDEGPGIPEKTLERIFDPYFTTKDTGTGLGLATSYSIVQKHDGHIMVESEVGKGTTFDIYLPGMSSQVSVKTEETEESLEGTGRVLLMDDEELVRDFVSVMLGTFGYSIECTKDGEEAFEVYRKNLEAGTPFDVIVMDLTVPGGMGGEELVRMIRDTDTKVKTIVSSGSGMNPVIASPGEYGFDAVVLKPYTVNEFCSTLRRVLAED